MNLGLSILPFFNRVEKAALRAVEAEVRAMQLGLRALWDTFAHKRLA